MLTLIITLTIIGNMIPATNKFRSNVQSKGWYEAMLGQEEVTQQPPNVYYMQPSMIQHLDVVTSSLRRIGRSFILMLTYSLVNPGVLYFLVKSVQLS